MVSRSIIVAILLSAAGSSTVTGAVSWFVMRSTACTDSSQLSPADQERRQKTEDFFKSTAPPMTGGQQMRPRW